jgi:hypothetical protein
MTIKTETISTDPWKFAATATLGDISCRYIGEEGESRATVKRIAKRQLENKLAKMSQSRNGTH